MADDFRDKSVWPTFLWALLAFCFLGLVAMVGVHFFGEEVKEYDRTRASERRENHEKLVKEEQEQLENYAWIDKAQSTVRLPVHRAMELTLHDLQQRKVGPSEVPVVPPAPAAGDSAATPADGAAPAASPAPAGAPAENAAPAPAQGASSTSVTPAPAPIAAPASSPTPAAPPAAEAAAPEPAAATLNAAPDPSPAASPAASPSPPAPAPAT